MTPREEFVKNAGALALTLSRTQRAWLRKLAVAFADEQHGYGAVNCICKIHDTCRTEFLRTCGLEADDDDDTTPNPCDVSILGGDPSL